MRYRISGEITKGDANKLNELIAKYGRDDGIVGGKVELSSPGGDYSEGIELAKFFKKRGITTYVRSGDQCLSACALAFLGGSYETESTVGYTSRQMEVGARIGFHAPFPKLPEGKFSKEDIELSFATAIKITSEYASMIDEWGIKPEMLNFLLKPDKSNLSYVDTVDNAASLGIEVIGLRPPDVIKRHEIFNACFNHKFWTKGYSSSLRWVKQIDWDDGFKKVFGDERFSTYHEIKIPPKNGGGKIALYLAGDDGDDGDFFCIFNSVAGKPSKSFVLGYAFGNFDDPSKLHLSLQNKILELIDGSEFRGLGSIVQQTQPTIDSSISQTRYLTYEGIRMWNGQFYDPDTRLLDIADPNFLATHENLYPSQYSK